MKKKDEESQELAGPIRFQVLNDNFFIDDTPLRGKCISHEDGSYEVADPNLRPELEILEKYGNVKIIKAGSCRTSIPQLPYEEDGIFVCDAFFVGTENVANRTIVLQDIEDTEQSIRVVNEAGVMYDGLRKIHGTIRIETNKQGKARYALTDHEDLNESEEDPTEDAAAVLIKFPELIGVLGIRQKATIISISGEIMSKVQALGVKIFNASQNLFKHGTGTGSPIVAGPLFTQSRVFIKPAGHHGVGDIQNFTLGEVLYRCVSQPRAAVVGVVKVSPNRIKIDYPDEPILNLSENHLKYIPTLLDSPPFPLYRTLTEDEEKAIMLSNIRGFYTFLEKNKLTTRDVLDMIPGEVLKIANNGTDLAVYYCLSKQPTEIAISDLYELLGTHNNIHIGISISNLEENGFVDKKWGDELDRSDRFVSLKKSL